MTSGVEGVWLGERRNWRKEDEEGRKVMNDEWCGWGVAW